MQLSSLAVFRELLLVFTVRWQRFPGKANSIVRRERQYWCFLMLKSFSGYEFHFSQGRMAHILHPGIASSAPPSTPLHRGCASICQESLANAMNSRTARWEQPEMNKLELRIKTAVWARGTDRSSQSLRVLIPWLEVIIILLITTPLAILWHLLIG